MIPEEVDKTGTDTDPEDLGVFYENNRGGTLIPPVP